MSENTKSTKSSDDKAVCNKKKYCDEIHRNEKKMLFRHFNQKKKMFCADDE